MTAGGTAPKSGDRAKAGGAGPGMLGKGRRQIESEFEKHEIEFVGLIRADQRIHSATWRGRISADDILVLETAPEGIDKVVSTFGLELVGSGAEVPRRPRFPSARVGYSL